MAVSSHLEYYRIGNSADRSADHEYPCLEPGMEWIACTVARYSPLNYRLLWHLNWGSGSLKVTESCTMRSADPENLILEPNITSIGKAVAKLWPFCRAGFSWWPRPGQGVAPPQKKIPKNIFLRGKRNVKFGHISGKYCVKFEHFLIIHT